MTIPGRPRSISLRPSQRSLRGSESSRLLRRTKQGRIFRCWGQTRWWVHFQWVHGVLFGWGDQEGAHCAPYPTTESCCRVKEQDYGRSSQGHDIWSGITTIPLGWGIQNYNINLEHVFPHIFGEKDTRGGIHRNSTLCESHFHNLECLLLSCSCWH